MASRQIKNQSSEGFEQQIKNISQAVGTIKGMYDTGEAIYGEMQVVAPYIEMGLVMLWI